MDSRERTVIATTSLLGSLVLYWYARAERKPETPHVLIGGVLGAIAGELVLHETSKHQKNDSDI